MRYGQERYGPALLVEAWEDFCLDDEADDLPQDTPHMPVFMPWLFFDWLPDPRDTDVKPAALDGLTLAQTYLRDHGRRIEPLLGEYMQACCEAPFSFYDVVSVRPGSDFVARDIFNGSETDVSERSASTQMRVGDILFAKIARLQGLALLEGLSPVCIPPDHREPILALRKHMARKKGPITQDRLREWGLDLLDTYRETVEPILNPRQPVLQNTDGDPFVQHTLVYDIESPQAAFHALAEVRAMLAEEMRRHYREWLDMKIPLLGNKTPRQAVKSRDGRELVEGLLLQMERQAEDQPAFDPAIVQELREALGLLQKPLL